ncbi:MAG: arylsulfatase [Cyclobacteriaceae bacterium]
MKNKFLSFIIGLAIVFNFVLKVSAQVTSHPNVLLVITDDQGYGDLGVNGNPHVRTPFIDAFARQSIRFKNFYVSPVCAPTRSSLMTGRYSLRTGVRDTYNGGAMMATEELTIAEVLKKAGYTTGVFGKWHLGDNYPFRPMDQGFDESIIHLGGGMGQVGDITTFFRYDSSYFDPVLWHNGQQQAYQGYCSDIFTAEAIRFIEKNQKNPFFCYLAFNAPHTPLQVPDKYYQIYKEIDPLSGFQEGGPPIRPMTEQDKEAARKVYAMVTNIDDNLGRLLRKLEELKISSNTIVIFMTDNGPQQNRYVAGMKGQKGSVHNGGIRVPFYFRYPSYAPKDIETTAAHIDVLPTLAEICNVTLPEERSIDGESLLPLIEEKRVDWEERGLFFYWNRRYPERYNNMALLRGRYKLVGDTDYNAMIENFQLYDMIEDPFEQVNIVGKKKNLAAELKAEMDRKYEELIRSENIVNPPLIAVGSNHEDPVILNRNDADGERGIWAQEEIFGKWRVSIREGRYNVRFKFIKPVEPGGQMYLETGPVIHQIKNVFKDTDIIEMKNVSLPQMEGDLIPFYSIASRRIFPFYVEIERIE